MSLLFESSLAADIIQQLPADTFLIILCAWAGLIKNLKVSNSSSGSLPSQK